MSDVFVKKIRDTRPGIKELELEIKNGKVSKYLSDFPVVYIHNWKNGLHEIYIGEANDIIKRTKQHLSGKREWQKLLRNNNSQLYIIGNNYFNKSMTMDIEDRLMHYMMGVKGVRKIHNARGNAQNVYYPCKKTNSIFEEIWHELEKHDKTLFPDFKKIEDSAIFKSSPLHKLNKDQEQAKQIILNTITKASRKKGKGNVVFIQGEAGTGKTVLNSSVFYELFCRKKCDKNKFNSVLLVNHNEQIKVYNQIARKLCIQDSNGQVVMKPTTFIHKRSPKNPVDVAFVDEAHLLMTQKNRGYQGDNHLDDICERAKVVVVMFDENQILRAEQYWEAEQIDRYKNEAIKNGTFKELKEQMRIQADKNVINWIDSFTKEGKIKKIKQTSKKYDLQICDTPKQLEDMIKNRARQKDSNLSRMVATYDWEYLDDNENKKRRNKRFTHYWVVQIGRWVRPWNYQLCKKIKKSDDLSWTEEKETLDEIGSIYTIQGFDLSYSGVILGPSVKYRDGRIVLDPSESKNKKATTNRHYGKKDIRNYSERLLRNEVRVLMTRGVKGMYIYACDDELRKALKNAVN